MILENENISNKGIRKNQVQHENKKNVVIFIGTVY